MVEKTVLLLVIEIFFSFMGMITFHSHYGSPCMTAPVTGPSAVPMTGIMTGPMTGLITGPMTGPVTGPMKGLMTKNRTHKM